MLMVIWWIIPFNIVPLVAAGTGELSQDDGFRLACALVGLGFSLWGLVELGFIGGTDGSNQYGPSPLAQPGDDAGSSAPGATVNKLLRD